MTITQEVTTPDAAAEERDIVQEVIDGYVALLRRYFPVPCTNEDTLLIEAGELPLGPTGLRYLADQLSTLAQATLAAATSDNPADLDAMERVAKQQRAESIIDTLYRETMLRRTVVKIAQLANSMTEHGTGRRVSTLYNIHCHVTGVLAAYRIPVAAWEDELDQYYTTMRALVATE